MTATNCPRCGRAQEPGARFCPQCGQDLLGGALPPNTLGVAPTPNTLGQPSQVPMPMQWGVPVPGATNKLITTIVVIIIIFVSVMVLLPILLALFVLTQVPDLPSLPPGFPFGTPPG